jgi:hypothetical protein
MNQKTTREKFIKWYSDHSKLITNGLKWFTLIIFLFFIARFIDLKQAKSAFSEIPISIFFLFIGMLCLSKIFYAARWKMINQSLLLDESIPISYFFTTNLLAEPISYFFTTNLLAEFVTIALPTSIGGEVTRFLKINSRNQNTVMTTTGIFIDRLIGLTTMAIVSVIVLLLMGQNFTINIREFLPQDYMIPFTLGTFLVGGLIAYGVIRWFKNSAYPEKIKTAWNLIKQNRLRLLTASIVSIIAHIIFSLSYIVIFQRLFPLPTISVIGVILTPQLARSIPISLFGVSGGEGLMVISQMMVGMPQSTALAITLISLIARYFFALCGFLFEISTDGVRFIKDLLN